MSTVMRTSTSVSGNGTTPSDLAHLASNMVRAAIAVTAGKMHFDAPRLAARQLRDDHPVAVSYFRHELARQISTLLLKMCGNVEAVYEEHDVPEGDELSPALPSLGQPIRLYVLVSLETAAAHTLINALSDALGVALSEQIERSVDRVIDPMVLDDRRSHLLKPRAMGYRPAPLLLASRHLIAPIGL